MKSLSLLMEDAFLDHVEEAYGKYLENKGYPKPAKFNRDALELGVIFESKEHKFFPYALAMAMANLSVNENYYNDVVDPGKRTSNILPTNQITWSGHSGIWNL